MIYIIDNGEAYDDHELLFVTVSDNWNDVSEHVELLLSLTVGPEGGIVGVAKDIEWRDGFEAYPVPELGASSTHLPLLRRCQDRRKKGSAPCDFHRTGCLLNGTNGFLNTTKSKSWCGTFKKWRGEE